MSLEVGFIAAFISIICWGSYFVPMKRVKRYDPFYFQALMCSSIFASSILVSSFLNAFLFSYLGIISGVLWASGNILSIQAIRNTGLSIAAPVWMGTGISTSFVWGTLLLNEILSSIVVGIAGLLLLIVGIVIVSLATGDGRDSSLRGILYAIAGGLLFGAYLVPFKLSSLEPTSFLFPMSLGILITGWVIYIIKRPGIDRKIVLQGASSGVIWNIGNIISFFAVLNLGISIGFPLTQLALFVSVLWGLLYFHEIREKKSIIRLFIGAIILFMGAILLALSL